MGRCERRRGGCGALPRGSKFSAQSGTFRCGQRPRAVGVSPPSGAGPGTSWAGDSRFHAEGLAMTRIVLDKVTKTYRLPKALRHRGPAVSALDLTIEAGEFLVPVGPSCCG